MLTAGADRLAGRLGASAAAAEYPRAEFVAGRCLDEEETGCELVSTGITTTNQFSVATPLFELEWANGTP